LQAGHGCLDVHVMCRRTTPHLCPPCPHAPWGQGCGGYLSSALFWQSGHWGVAVPACCRMARRHVLWKLCPHPGHWPGFVVPPASFCHGILGTRRIPGRAAPCAAAGGLWQPGLHALGGLQPAFLRRWLPGPGPGVIGGGHWPHGRRGGQSPSSAAAPRCPCPPRPACAARLPSPAPRECHRGCRRQ